PPVSGAACVAVAAETAPYSFVTRSPTASGKVNEVSVVACASGLLKFTVYCWAGRLLKQNGSVPSVTWLATMTLLLIIRLTPTLVRRVSPGSRVLFLFASSKAKTHTELPVPEAA